MDSVLWSRLHVRGGPMGNLPPFQNNHKGQFVWQMQILPWVSQHSTAQACTGHAAKPLNQGSSSHWAGAGCLLHNASVFWRGEKCTADASDLSLLFSQLQSLCEVWETSRTKVGLLREKRVLCLLLGTRRRADWPGGEIRSSKEDMPLSSTALGKSSKRLSYGMR